MLGSAPLPPLSSSALIPPPPANQSFGGSDSHFGNPQSSFPSLTSTFNLKDLIDLEVQRQKIELRKAQADVEAVELDVQRKRIDVERDRLTLERDRLTLAEARLKLQKEYSVTLDDVVHVPSSTSDFPSTSKRAAVSAPRYGNGSNARTGVAESRRRSRSQSPPAASSAGAPGSRAVVSHSAARHASPTLSGNGGTRNRILSELESSAGFEMAPKGGRGESASRKATMAATTALSALSAKGEARTKTEREKERKEEKGRWKEKDKERTGEEHSWEGGRATRSSGRKDLSTELPPAPKISECPVHISERDLWTKVMIERHGSVLRDLLTSGGGVKTTLHSAAMQGMQNFLKTHYQDAWHTFKEPGRGWLVPTAKAEELDKYLVDTVAGWPTDGADRKWEREKEKEKEMKLKEKDKLKESDKEKEKDGTGATKRTRGSVEAEEVVGHEESGTERAGKKRKTARPSANRIPWIELFRNRYGERRWDNFYRTCNRSEQDSMRDLIKMYLNERYGNTVATGIVMSNKRFLVVPMEEAEALDTYMKEKAKKWLRDGEVNGGETEGIANQGKDRTEAITDGDGDEAMGEAGGRVEDGQDSMGEFGKEIEDNDDQATVSKASDGGTGGKENDEQNPRVSAEVDGDGEREGDDEGPGGVKSGEDDADELEGKVGSGDGDDDTKNTVEESSSDMSSHDDEDL
ncbi:hypothetical protein HDU93_009718 [Gonapodya sp. JEL0774]|nr:hypothetical protein HDU93_009718 [Gonapodya sp. JEL0774]